jgi:hypothetical protein
VRLAAFTDGHSTTGTLARIQGGAS